MNGEVKAKLSSMSYYLPVPSCCKGDVNLPKTENFDL